MRKLFMAMCLLLVAGIAGAQSHVIIDNGRSAVAYQVWVATATYQIINADEAGAYNCYTLKSMGGTFWFDFDSSVSTSRSGLTYKINGITGESAKIAPNEHITINGQLNSGVWVISDSLSPGCTIQVIINRAY